MRIGCLCGMEPIRDTRDVHKRTNRMSLVKIGRGGHPISVAPGDMSPFVVPCQWGGDSPDCAPRFSCTAIFVKHLLNTPPQKQ